MHTKLVALLTFIRIAAAAASVATTTELFPTTISETFNGNITLKGFGYLASPPKVFVTSIDYTTSATATTEIVNVVVLSDSNAMFHLHAESFNLQSITTYTFGTDSGYNAALRVHKPILLDPGQHFLTRHSEAGGETVTFHGLAMGEIPSFVKPSDILFRFQDTTANLRVEVPVTKLTVNENGAIAETQSPPWSIPSDWYTQCSDPSNPDRNEANCVVDQTNVKVSISVNGGVEYSDGVGFLYGFVKPVRVAFVHNAPFSALSFSYYWDQARKSLEAEYGSRVLVLHNVENVPGGQYELRQSNSGRTIATNTPVEPTFEDEHGNVVPNSYYQGFELFKQFCDEKIDIVFATSNGYFNQLLDVSEGYPSCGRPTATNPNPLHTTFFVTVLAPYETPVIRSTLGKIYQARYLSGMAVGHALTGRFPSLATPRNKKCVSFFGTFPEPGVIRGINAFTIGCRKVFPECVVKVSWTGSWYHEQLDSMLGIHAWHVQECDIMATFTNSVGGIRYFTQQGGLAVGYSQDSGSFFGNNVLVSGLYDWKPALFKFVEQVEKNVWDPKALDPDFGGIQARLYFPGIAEGGVTLSHPFSPKLPKSIQNNISAEVAVLESLKGGDAYKHIFCGSAMKKRWVFKRTDGQVKPISGCKLQPTWERLQVTEYVNLKHFRDQDGLALPLGMNELRDGDCLFGIDYPLQAILTSPFAQDSDPDRVFSDFLVDGAELLPYENSTFGTIHDSETSCDPNNPWPLPIGDRFFQPPVVYEECTAGFIQVTRSECQVATIQTALTYSWIDESKRCGSILNEYGYILQPVSLPDDLPGIPCDFVPIDSDIGIAILVVVIFATGVCILFLVQVFRHRNEPAIKKSQTGLLMLICFGCGALNLISLLEIGREPNTIWCIAYLASFHCFLSMVLGAIMAKIFRIHKIFNNQRMTSLRLSDGYMYRLCATYVMFDVILITVVLLLDPVYIQQVEFTDVNIPAEVHHSGLLQVSCTTSQGLLNAIEIFFKGSSVLYGLYLLFQTRHVSGDFVEHKYIMLSFYNIVIGGGVVFLVTSTSQNNPVLIVMIKTCAIAYTSTLTVALLTIPKLQHLQDFSSRFIGSGSSNSHGTKTAEATPPSAHAQLPMTDSL